MDISDYEKYVCRNDFVPWQKSVEERFEEAQTAEKFRLQNEARVTTLLEVTTERLNKMEDKQSRQFWETPTGSKIVNSMIIGLYALLAAAVGINVFNYLK